MNLFQILTLSVVEIGGDVALKTYANDGGILYLGLGVVGYLWLVVLLVITLQDSTILMVNNAWDGTSSLLESLFAYFVLGERFDNYLQYFGAFFIVLGLYLLKIPLSNSHPFHIPKS